MVNFNLVWEIGEVKFFFQASFLAECCEVHRAQRARFFLIKQTVPWGGWHSNTCQLLLSKTSPSSLPAEMVYHAKPWFANSNLPSGAIIIRNLHHFQSKSSLLAMKKKRFPILDLFPKT